MAVTDRTLVDEVVEQSGGSVRVAIDNCPHQVVLSGPAEAMDNAAAVLQERGAVSSPVAFDRPYHTPEFAEFGRALADLYRKLPFAAPKLRLYSCATATAFPDEPDEIRALAAEQWSRRVRFRETIEAMYEDGVRLFLEVGPGGNLSGFVSDILRGGRTWQRRSTFRGAPE